MKVFRLNEYEWYAANDLEEAVDAAMKLTGCSREEVLDDLYAGELSEAKLKGFDLLDDDDNIVCTAFDQLNEHIESGKPAGFLFGSE